MVTPPFWFAVFFVALGGSLAGAMYMQARSPDPHPVFASRAWRISIWIGAFGMIWLALSSILPKNTLVSPFC